MIVISVCICTRRREEELIKLLESIQVIKVPEDVSVNLIIVENDTEEFSKGAVLKFSETSKFQIRYFLEKNPGISYARNRSVQESSGSDFCCFIDDDQTVDENWLVELVKCQKEFSADAVSGSTPPVFEYAVPKYIEKFHQDERLPYGTIIEKAATGCLMVKKEYLDKIPGPFDLRLNFTGGEDFFMTHHITKLGGKIVVNHDAISYEIIPRDRATIKYVRKRTVRVANTQLVVKSLTDPGFKLMPVILKSIVRFARGIVIFIPYYVFPNEDKLLGLFKISYSWGVFMYAFGKKNRFYK